MAAENSFLLSQEKLNFKILERKQLFLYSNIFRVIFQSITVLLYQINAALENK